MRMAVRIWGAISLAYVQGEPWMRYIISICAGSMMGLGADDGDGC